MHSRGWIESEVDLTPAAAGDLGRLTGRCDDGVRASLAGPPQRCADACVRGVPHGPPAEIYEGSSVQWRAMVDGIDCDLRILGRVESVTCRAGWAVLGMNPTFAASPESAFRPGSLLTKQRSSR